jgi:predicted PurR-regulated permease PerM
LIGIDPKAARITWTAAITLLFLAALYAIRGTLVVFAVALLFAYLLHPLFDHISRRFSSTNRIPALALTYLLVMGLLAAIGIAVGARVAAEARHLILHPPDVQGFLDRLRIAHPALTPMIESAEGSIHQQLGEIASVSPRFSLSVLAASGNLVYLIVIPILSFFMLKDGKRIQDAFLAMFGAGESRVNAERTLAEVHVLLLQYMRNLLILCCTALAVLGVVLTVIGVRYALLLASIGFFCEFVPLVGPITETVVILGVSALTGYPHLWWLAAFLGGFRLVQDYGIWPRLMSHGVELHPLWVIFGVFAGGKIGGAAGVFLSVPVLALARLVLIPVQSSQSEQLRTPAASR